MRAPSPLHLLAVDDEPDLEPLLRQVFRQEVRAGQYELTFARDGVAALARLDADPTIAVVLTDLRMPGMDGLDLLEAMRRRERPPRVVVVSAYGDHASIRAAMNRGAYDFVTKPVDRDDLRATVIKTWAEAEGDREAAAARERLTAAQRELEVAREVQAAKARFFADLSHEVRTPLTLLLGPLQDARRGTYGGPDVVPPEVVRLMHRNGVLLKRLLDGILDLAKLDAAALTLRAAEHDLGALLRDQHGVFAPAAERKRIRFGLDTPDEPVPLFFEPEKLETVFANLLSNAVKFTPAGGTVRVRLTSEAEAVEVEVRDSGPGLPPEAHARVFERFYQHPSTAGHGGTGIGLALVKELVELHGGQVRLESEPGFGATFTVRLSRGAAHLRPEDLAGEAADVPVRHAEETGDASGDATAWTLGAEDAAADEDDQAPAPRADAAERPVVLVADDHADVRAYLRRHLATRYRVVEAEGGDEALARARTVRPALVIADVQMPGRNGIALCRALRGDDVLGAVPIVLLTARADEADRIEGLAAGADAYLTKPFDAREVLVRVENLIEIRRRLRERFSQEVVLSGTEIVVPSADQAFLESVRDAIEARMHRSTFKIHEAAEEVGVSPRHLRRRLRELTGLSPAGFVRTLRMQRAVQLVQQEAGTIAEIAYAVGFADAKYFSRVFREVFGVNPSEFGG